jgi:hypothetical protein
MTSRWIAIAGMLVPLACTTLSAQEDRPAVLTQIDQPGRANLLRVVREALNGAPVTFADDAFTRSSEHVFERRTVRDAEGRPLDGRRVAMPERLRLVVNGERCALIRASDGARFELEHVRCGRAEHARQ